MDSIVNRILQQPFKYITPEESDARNMHPNTFTPFLRMSYCRRCGELCRSERCTKCGSSLLAQQNKKTLKKFLDNAPNNTFPEFEGKSHVGRWQSSDEYAILAHYNREQTFGIIVFKAHGAQIRTIMPRMSPSTLGKTGSTL
ncbi:hypothetical protein DFQ29_006641 [Apophysomyces sp. BC1021]|nr:hypothetical protein DFQ29_006641 [Apophysomyces sp. BC1021]